MLVSNLKFDTSPTEDAVLGPGAWKGSLAEPTITTKDGKTCAYFNGSNSGLISTKEYFPNIDAYKDDWMVSLNVNFSNTDKMCFVSKNDFNHSVSSTPFMLEYNYELQLFGNGTGIIPTNQWNLISAVHTNKNIYLYINNVLANTIAETYISATSLNSTNSFTIGFLSGYYKHKFNGYMSDFRIYKDETSIPVSRSKLFDDSDKNYYGVKA